MSGEEFGGMSVAKKSTVGIFLCKRMEEQAKRALSLLLVIIYPWRGAGVVELACLENKCAFTGTEGSNPSLSAIKKVECLLNFFNVWGSNPNK